MARSKCPHCQGTGNTIVWIVNIPELIECSYCNGTGEAQGD